MLPCAVPKGHPSRQLEQRLVKRCLFLIVLQKRKSPNISQKVLPTQSLELPHELLKTGSTSCHGSPKAMHAAKTYMAKSKALTSPDEVSHPRSAPCTRTSYLPLFMPAVWIGSCFKSQDACHVHLLPASIIPEPS